MNAEEVRKKANEILGHNKINILENEKETIETLQELEKTDETNLEYKMKTLKNIEEYLKYKEKMIFAKKDMEKITKLANQLREQETRITDSNNPPLFMIKNSIGKNIYFLTRNALEEYKECNKDCSKTIEILGSDSQELANLLEIVKRNF